VEQFAGKVKVVLVSHIHNSQDNLQNLLNCVETSQTFFDLIAITTERVGVSGKLATLKALAPGGLEADFCCSMTIGRSGRNLQGKGLHSFRFGSLLRDFLFRGKDLRGAHRLHTWLT
jgi:hypothetical protein